MHNVRVNAGWKLRAWWRSQGSSGGSQEEVGRKAGGRLGDPSVEGASGLQPSGVGAPGEEGSLVSCWTVRLRACREVRHDMERQRPGRPARVLPNKRARVTTHLAWAIPSGRAAGVVAGVCGAQPQHRLGSGHPATDA